MAPVLVRRPGTQAQLPARYAPRPVAPSRQPARQTGSLAPPSRADLERFRRQLAALPVANTLELAPQRRVAVLGGRQITLAQREFTLLAFLTTRTPGVASRQDIARAVWRDATKAASRTIDVHVARLRDKLGQSDLVLTERGQGYRLNPSFRVRVIP